MMAAMIWDNDSINFLSSQMGLCFVAKKLEPYTEQGLKYVHAEVSKVMAAVPPCTVQCSRTYGSNITSWCKSCRGWKKWLDQFRRKRVPLNIARCHSWKWNESYQDIIEFYCPNEWETIPGIRDIACSCHIWKNCTKFKIKSFVTSNVQKVRNKYVAHNQDLKVSDDQKSEIFDALQDLVKDSDISNIDTRECIEQLINIQNGDVCNEVTRMLHMQLKIDQHQVTLESIEKTVERILAQTFDSQHPGLNVRNICKTAFGQLTKCFVICFMVMIIATMIIAFTFTYVNTPKQGIVEQYSDTCISEDYSFPVPQDLPLNGYFSNHGPLVGRDWLFAELEKDIFKDDKMHGIIIKAELGYGKSALVNQVLCAKDGEKGSHMKANVVAFHICKFDVASTTNPARFVTRTAGLLSSTIPEYKTFLKEKLPADSIIYDRFECEREIEACFDQAITIPFQKLNNINMGVRANKLFVIDAIDECVDPRVNKNHIMDILLSRMWKFPKWIKFLITSRHINLSEDILRYFHEKLLLAQDSRNVEDINKYIIDNMPVSVDADILLKQSGGNFQYVISVLELEENILNINQSLPRSMDDIYNHNFDRLFPNQESFDMAKTTFEIVAASYFRKPSDQLNDLLSWNKNQLYGKATLQFDVLSHFIANQSEGLTFYHQSLFVWLTSNTNQKYRISVPNGHGMISNYYLNKSLISTVSDLVKLSIHVAESRNETLQTRFMSLRLGEFKQNPIHEFIRRYSSVAGLKLLFHHFPRLNDMDKYGETMAFIAAKQGHTMQLKYLETHGNIFTFRKHSNDVLYKNYLPTRLGQNETLSGFNLLHVATMYHRIDAVRYLLTKLDTPTIQQKTAMGHTADEIACEKGFLDILSVLKPSADKFVNCMYYAAAENHIELIKILSEEMKSSQIECVSDSESQLAFDQVTEIALDNWYEKDPSQLLDLSLSIRAMKDTPLHMAVRRFSVDVAEFLIDTYPNLLNCNNAFGITPMLLAVNLNRSSLFKGMVNQVMLDKCSERSLVINKTLEHTWMGYSDIGFIHYLVMFGICDNFCIPGMTFAHLAVLHNRQHMLKFVHSKYGSMFEWNVKDYSGRYPHDYKGISDTVLYRCKKFFSLVDSGLLENQIH
ncbi:uncharacterized protein LOC128222803 [Mya arenaria]|uniref:uncharacterized protein LOC128222803 n=1 Tax=Mya arenaria TaxID=6604 RepID=UPI0022E04C3A|nr:uncharacterized protein LOC128222803 [Mya arenaria]